ncbi:peroxidase [Anoxybacter fermentans]|uniref:Peroxidase n=3 Tax=Anoxybacter fermentans TaxID=1323375 RepID=A0A3S9SZY9_9FIRM|nr:carboxymuconolactone decarboxylase family protein [Anoxybacter fermentans]AZR73820.1 peroxidase [Anoxybacter fermentans]
MAWIKVINENEAKGKLKKLYDRLMGPDKSQVANILKVHSLNPDVLEAHLNLYRRVMFGQSGLSRAQREMIAVVVSSVNSCHY